MTVEEKVLGLEVPVDDLLRDWVGVGVRVRVRVRIRIRVRVKVRVEVSVTTTITLVRMMLLVCGDLTSSTLPPCQFHANKLGS